MDRQGDQWREGAWAGLGEDQIGQPELPGNHGGDETIYGEFNPGERRRIGSQEGEILKIFRGQEWTVLDSLRSPVTIPIRHPFADS